MIKRKTKKAVRLVSSADGVGVITSRKDGTLGEGTLSSGSISATDVTYLADDIVKLYDGKTLKRIGGNLIISD